MRLAFPSIVVDVHGAHEYRDGALFSLPAELTDRYRIDRYLALKDVGWSKTEFGYMALVREDSYGNRYILPGLFLLDGPNPTKKISGYKAVFSKKQVEQYISKHLEWEAEVRQKTELELTALVHDLRHLSGSIYHSAIEAENANNDRDRSRTAELIKTIIASQTMLRVRIDYLDFVNSVDRFDDIEKIPVYSRVDKVKRCFSASAKHKNIEIFLSGESFRLAEGPNILDIVPYTLIENAIKYAPNDTNIYIEVRDTEFESEVSVESIGPRLEENELTSIFARGFRGANAIKVRSSGTGLGLYVANDVMEVFQGRISVSQDDEIHWIDGIQYSKIAFSFSLPTSGEDAVRRKKIGRSRGASGSKAFLSPISSR